jgi:hypothetical protein
MSHLRPRTKAAKKRRLLEKAQRRAKKKKLPNFGICPIRAK